MLNRLLVSALAALATAVVFTVSGLYCWQRDTGIGYGPR
jgi:hypothetical protein